MNCGSYEVFFRNFSNKTSFSIMLLLRSKPMSVTEIAEKLSEEQSKVSHSLAKLAKCHILNVERQGKSRIYSLNKDTVIPIMSLIQKHVEKHCTERCKE
jgi:DNA-binding transcriptional ArsR family regulator